MAGTVTIPSTTTTYHRVFAVKEATILTTTEGTPAATGVTIEGARSTSTGEASRPFAPEDVFDRSYIGV